MNQKQQRKLPGVSRQFLHSMPLNMFEDMFEPLIEQSKNITIRYHFQEDKSQSTFSGSIVVYSVNDTLCPDDFRVKLINLVESSMQKFGDFLESLDPLQIDPCIDYFIGKLKGLQSLVGNESLFVRGVGEDCTLQCQFRTFKRYRLVGPDTGDCRLFSQAICYKAEIFADVWLQVIDAALDHLELIRNIAKQSLADEVSGNSMISDSKSQFSLKFNMSVSHVGCMFHLLYKSELIDVPDRCIPSLIEWMTGNFQSKNKENISSSSLRNKFFTPDLASLDFWEQKLQDGIKRIRDIRERLIK